MRLGDKKILLSLFPWSVAWGSFSAVRHSSDIRISRYGNAKNCSCSRVFCMSGLFREMSVNARTSKNMESTDRDLSTIPTDCCRLCTRRGNDAAIRILNANKFVNITSSNQVTDHRNMTVAISFHQNHFSSNKTT
ncbi:hypothetical protein AVEN_271686-1 [Araneus ventricosus]|uniref:Secreted protein n=1 Tax=Araneus ventricosus TaxID=182803 RepID=A0A4Y2JB02_ARAVE|nr:hypothetical protein AVEN_271686-1 [Araneus ventricosus]